jgi:GTP-binding protein
VDERRSYAVGQPPWHLQCRSVFPPRLGIAVGGCHWSEVRVVEASVSKPIVAIVGRQNVGKSTLLNRMAGKPIAIVEDLPGTTRDRIFADVSWQEGEFTLVDTGGLELTPQSTITQAVKEQVEVAIAEADVIIFLVDLKSGVIPTDLEIADILRQVHKPIVLVANKADNVKLESEVVEFYELGLGEPLAISAYHDRGITELLDRVTAVLPPPSPVEAEPEVLKIAIVGRPNVGKSMLLNTLLGGERSIVDEAPGTTRDAIDTLLDFYGQSVLLIDTAGIRRRGRLGAGVERYSVIRALRAIERADIALLVLDATELLTAQDMHIAGYIQQAAKGIVLLVNKWDLVADKNISEYNNYIRSRLRFMAYAPVLYISAKFGQGVDKIMPQVSQVYQERLKRLSTTAVNNAIQEAVAAHNPPRTGSKQLKILYATQTEVNPPTFVFFVNDAKLIHFSYQRYLENKLRESFGFVGTPCRLTFKTRGES